MNFQENFALLHAEERRRLHVPRVDPLASYGMMHRLSQAAQQSQVRGDIASGATCTNAKCKEKHEVLERMANEPSPVGYVLKGMARDVLGIKSK